MHRFPSRLLPVFGLILAVSVLPAHAAKKPAPARTVAESALKFTAVYQKRQPTLSQINNGKYPISIKVTNTGKKKIVFFGYLSLDVLDSEEDPVKKTRNLGRFGRRRGGSIIENMRFKALKPGQSFSFDLKLSLYTHDPNLITAWRIPKTGDYDLVFNYQYDRKAVKKSYGRGCKVLDDPNQLWNKAIELKHTIRVPLTVR